MEWRDFFSRTLVVEERAEKGEPTAAGKKRTNREGVFVTEQSITTFPVMSGLVTGIWIAIEKGLNWEHTFWIGVVLSLIAGVFLFFEHETDPRKHRDSRLFVRIGVAVANTAVLFFAASGVYIWTPLAK